jgi:PKD repeat protein
LTVNFTGSVSGGTPPYSYSWNFGDGLSSTAQNPSHIYSIAGNYTVTFTVTDSASAAANASVIIVVSNKNPLDPAAQFSANPSQGTSPLLVNFDASASYSPNGSISSFEWDFGDGSRGSGKIVSHTFKNRGKFSVVLRVTDNAMRTGTATGEVVAYTKPTALFTTYSLSGRAPRIIGFDASPSYDNGGTIVSYNWSFGDGTSGTGKAVVHTFAKNGSYIVTLSVVNDQGYASEVSKTITVNGSTRERRR